MENTTKMYIEHIAIGMQTTLLLLFVFVCLEPNLIAKLITVSTAMELIIVVPIAYALGILVDRISKLLLDSEKIEEQIKKRVCKKVLEYEIRDIYKCHTKKNCKNCQLNMISRVVWKKVGEMDYYHDARTRKRILRATFFNSGLAMIVIIVLFVAKKSILSKITNLVLIICLGLITISSLFIYIKFMIDYYKKLKKYIRALQGKTRKELLERELA